MNFFPFPVLIDEIPDFFSYESDDAINFVIDNWFNPTCKGGVHISVCFPRHNNWNLDEAEVAMRKWAEVQWDWKRIIRRLQQPEGINLNEYVAERCP